MKEEKKHSEEIHEEISKREADNRSEEMAARNREIVNRKSIIIENRKSAGIIKYFTPR